MKTVSIIVIIPTDKVDTIKTEWDKAFLQWEKEDFKQQPCNADGREGKSVSYYVWSANLFQSEYDKISAFFDAQGISYKQARCAINESTGREYKAEKEREELTKLSVVKIQKTQVLER